MKFTDGYWQVLPGVEILRPRFVESVADCGDHLTVYAATAPLGTRGDTLNRPMITVRLDSPAEGVIGVRIEHFQGCATAARTSSSARSRHRSRCTSAPTSPRSPLGR